jgi:hypothetical protein
LAEVGGAGGSPAGGSGWGGSAGGCGGGGSLGGGCGFEGSVTGGFCAGGSMGGGGWGVVASARGRASRFTNGRALRDSGDFVSS